MPLPPGDPYAAQAAPLPAGDPYAHPAPDARPSGDPYSTAHAIDPSPLRDKIDAGATKHNVSQTDAEAIASTESSLNPRATSKAGAQGLFQLMPGTAKSHGVTDPFNVDQNISGGLSLYHELLVKYKGDNKKALAAYNAGEGAVDQYGGIPPFKETQDYVKKIDAQIHSAMSRAAAGLGGVGAKIFGGSVAEAADARPKGDPYAMGSGLQPKAAPGPAIDPKVFQNTAPERARLNRGMQIAGELGDAFTFAPANAAARDLAGDHKAGLYNYAKTLFDPNKDAGKTLDETAAEYGFNAPGDIKYWGSQPGMRSSIMKATPSTPLGLALQLSLGMHADLARLKPAHPYISGAETMAAELFNPAYMASGEFGGMLARGADVLSTAARAGKYGAPMQRLAKLASKAPVAGDRFTQMTDAGGPVWENAHASLAREMSNAPHYAQDAHTSTDTFGGANIDDQIEIAHAIENPANPRPSATKQIGDLTVEQRAQNVAAWRRANIENPLRAIDPEMAKKLLGTGDEYVPHGGAWDLQQSGGNPQWDQTSVAGARGGGATSTAGIQGGRVHETLAEGQQAGLNIDPDWTPSGAFASHDAKVLRYIKLADWVDSFKSAKTLSGSPGLFDIEYKFPMANGTIRSVGTGPAGYDRFQQLAADYGVKRAEAEAAAKGAAKGWSQDEIDAWAKNQADHYKSVAVDEVRRVFRSQHPDHDFDASESLGMPMLKGKALHHAAVDAAIDSHPILRNLQKGEGGERFAIHTQDADLKSPLAAWNDNINSVVRQGLLSNVVYHPVFNLLPLALNEGVNPVWLARAMALDRKGSLIPKAMLDRAQQFNANAPKFGSSLSMDPHVRAKILTVPYEGLSPAEMAQKALTAGSRWNQDVTFGWFEDRIAAVTMKHFEDQIKRARPGISSEESGAMAARQTRKVLGDYENVTPGDRKLGYANWQYFYTWMRGQLRYFGGQALTHPERILAQTRGVQTANQLQGDEGSGSGSALSTRKLFGTDAHGNPRYLSVPTPQLRYGTDVMETGASILSGKPTDAATVATKLVTSHLPPLAGIGLGLAATAILPADIPKPYDLRLFDKNAPSAAAMWMQAGKKIIDRYTPGQIRAPLEAAAAHDPTLAIGAVGPSMYTSSNTTPQSKAAYGVQIGLRSALKKAHDGANHAAENHYYDLLQRVSDGDPLAVAQAKRELAEIQRGQRRGTHART